MSLNTIYKKVTRECYIDDRGVYTADGERVALSNDGECYVRYDGTPTANKLGPADYEVTTPYVVVGSSVCADAAELLRATISAVVSCNATITEVTSSKQDIAESEGIDLSKFADVALVKVSYNLVEHKTYDFPCVL